MVISGRRMNILSGIASQIALAIEMNQLYQQTVQQERLHRVLRNAPEDSADSLAELVDAAVHVFRGDDPNLTISPWWCPRGQSDSHKTGPAEGRPQAGLPTCRPNGTERRTLVRRSVNVRSRLADYFWMPL